MTHDLFNTRQSFTLASGKQGTLYSLPALVRRAPRTLTIRRKDGSILPYVLRELVAQ